MNILLLGYGKMGKLIEELALAQGHSIIDIITSKNPNELNSINHDAIDVAIEFSNPMSVVNNIKWCVDRQIPIVVGTTGWQEQKSEIDNYCLKNSGTYLFASNFSIGVNLFFQLNERLASMMNTHSGYDPSIVEIHHTQKLDAPSGTAITLAEEIIDNLERKSNWSKSDTSKANSISIKSERVDPIPGTHSIIYESGTDSIEIKHTAHSRLGFATGALSVAEWIIHKKGVLSMKNFLSL